MGGAPTQRKVVWIDRAKRLSWMLSKKVLPETIVAELIAAIRRVLQQSVFESRLHQEANLARMANLLQHQPPEWFLGKTILEVGSGEGDPGQFLVELGSRVISCDGRASNIRRLRRKYSNREAFVIDLDRQQIPGNYDAILCFGTLYHLSNPERFLRQLTSPILFLESIVTDSYAPVCPFVREPSTPDQALSKYGCRPSPTWIIEHLPQYKMADISTATANWSNVVYDWVPRNDGQWIRDGKELRKMWIGHRISAGSYFSLRSPAALKTRFIVGDG